MGAVALLVAGSLPVGSRPVTNLVVERVDASFVLPASGGGFDYLVFYALRRIDPSTGRVTSTKAYAGKGECVRSPRGGLSCQTKVQPHRIGRFHANEAFTRISVTLARNETKHRLTFRAVDDHPASGREVPNECGGVSVRGYEIARTARARGLLFGRRVDSRDEKRGEKESVSRYLEISACA